MGPRIQVITPEICQVGGPGLTHPNDAAIYLVNFANASALVDAGSGRASDRVLMNIEAAGVDARDIRYLLLTHCHYDHSGGASAFRKRFGWRVAIHASEVECLESGDSQVSAASWYGDSLAPCPVDIRLADGDRLSLGDRALEVIHIPGHSPGSVAYLVESTGQRVLFAQDVHGPIHPTLHSDPVAYQASLRRLLALDVDVLCEGHYGVFSGRAQISRFIERFIER